MNKEPGPIAKEIETLIKKASEANTVIISETAKFISRIANSKIKPAEMASIQKKLLLDAVNSFIKLNIQYTSSLIDAGVTISKNINKHLSAAAEAAENTNASAPAIQETEKLAFELKTTTPAGGTATTAFLIHNDKQEPVNCSIVISDFINESDGTISPPLNVVFNPKAFELNYGSAQRVDVSASTPAAMKPGLYRSHISVEGFEHTHFDILLDVTPAKDNDQAITNTTSKPVKKAASKKKAAVKNTRKPKSKP